MEFVSKGLAIKLKEKGFDKPCFGFYNLIQDELQLYCSNDRDVTYKNLLTSVKNNKEIFDAPTIEQVLEWLREEKDIHIWIVPQKIFDYTYYGLQMIQFNSPKHNFETFTLSLSLNNKNYYDVCTIGIECAIDNII